MRGITRRIMLLAAAVVAVSVAAVAVVVSGPSLVAFTQTDPAGAGVTLKINSVSIPGDRKPVVNFSLTDAKGSPLRIADVDDGGLRFLIARIETEPDSNLTKVVNYVVTNRAGANYQYNGQTVKPTLASATQAGVDTGGVFSDLGGGRFTYQFATTLPANFNAGLTHVVGGYATRNARAFVSNDVFSFVPMGGPVQVQREVVQTQSCNACHDNLAAHGGTRREVGVCVLCHTSQTTDPETANTVEFKVLVHKLHSGAHLPSVEAGQPYVIIGNRQNVFDFSGIRWPQDTRNCQTCHTGAQSDNFKTKPSAEACGACHDTVNFKTGANHPGGAQTNASCATCHQPDGPEFGPSVTGAHTIPEKSKQLRGVNFNIVSFTDTKPGQSPKVVFNIKDNAGQPVKPSEMASLSFLLAGPTTDYAAPPISEDARQATAATDGNFAFTFRGKIPAEATGTFAVGVQGYLMQDLTKPSGEVIQVRDVGFNKVAYGAVTDSVPQPRKQVVDVKNCNVCHETLALHGGTRRNTELCVLCHNSQNTDVGKRTTAKGPMPPESISFNRLIHRIHTGEEQQDKPFIVYGGSPASPGPINLSEALFPTDRRNCEKCHTAGSNLLSFMRQNVLPTTVKQGDTVVSVTPPIQNVCLSCHDGGPAKVHAQTNTSNLQESCTVCHNEGREFAVSKAHAR